jgi:hypothetical protein
MRFCDFFLKEERVGAGQDLHLSCGDSLKPSRHLMMVEKCLWCQ